MKFSNGKVVTHTLELRMAARDESWLGIGFSDLKENRLWYNERVNFTEDGKCSITLLHVMRKNGEVLGIHSLIGITDVGFRIEYT